MNNPRIRGTDYKRGREIMIYNKPQIYEALNAILPTYYEQFVDEEITLPYITYIESSNIDDTITCETMGYSIQYYQIKIWGNSVDELSQTAQDVDKTMRSLGYKRTARNELLVGPMICIVLTYKGLGFENNFMEE